MTAIRSIDRSRQVNLIMRKGDTFKWVITVANPDASPYVFTDHTATCKVYSGPQDILENYSFVVTLSEGQILVEMTAANSAKMRRGAWIYFLKIVNLEGTFTWLNGLLTINEGTYDGVVQTSSIVINPQGTALTLTIEGSGSGSSEVFEEDIVVNLAAGKTFGKYVDGETIPAEGLTPGEVILLATDEYIDPIWLSFLMRNVGNTATQAAIIEVGETLSGVRRFLWSTQANSGSIPTIGIKDHTADVFLVTGTVNDGDHSVDIGSHQLNAADATYSWKGGMQDDNAEDPDAYIYSSLFTVTAKFLRFHGPTATIPNSSATVRALPDSNDFQVANVETFDLLTGTVQTIFAVALPPGRTITSVIDVDALNADITANYVLIGTQNVQDNGGIGTNRVYNLYAMTAGVPYLTSHRHRITTA